MVPREMSRIMLEAWTNRDWDTIRGVLHSDYQYIGPDGEIASGVEGGLTAGWTSFAEGFPDAKWEIDSVYVDGDTVITEFRVIGTHAGTFDGLAPTGNAIEIDFCNVMELEDGLVLRERDYFDTLKFMAELGVVEAP